ncbi:MAG TPA: HD domain-containing phosphohydrolase [Acidimicrobiia bacterium]
MKWFEPEPRARVPVWQQVAVPVAAAVLALASLPSATGSPLALVVGVVSLATAMQIRVPVSHGTRFGLSVAIGVAAPIHFSSGGAVDLPSVLTVLGGGIALGSLVFLFRPTQSELLTSVVRRLIGMVIYALVFAFIAHLAAVQAVDAGWRVMIPLAIGAIVWLLAEVVFWVLTESPKDLRRQHLAQAIVGDLNVFVSLVATGALFALTYEKLGFLALGVAGLPYLFAHSAFARFLTIKRTYRQTIRALARIPEVAGLGVDGHADRTAGLALAVGSALGLSRNEIDDLEYAALMHDIGRITLTEPAILRVGYTDDDIARWGAEIISQAPYLDRIAEHVRRLHEPYRKPGEQSDPSISSISKIVRATSAFDHLVVERKLSALQAIEVLHQGAAYDFDPTVVAAMRRVLDRRLAFHPVVALPSR